MAALVVASGCAEPPDSGLRVESLDATFGLARVGPVPDKADDTSGPAGTGGGEDATIAVQDGATATPDALMAADAAPPARMCRNVAAFIDKVTPALVERCVRCHDGTKSKATKTLDLTPARDMAPSAQQRACDAMLKSAPDSTERSPIFAEVNPADTVTVHDFKYPSSPAYMAYRSAVLTWLESEPAN